MFQPEDLVKLDGLLSCASGVVPMADIFDWFTHPGNTHIVGMRHDCDNVIAPAVCMAEWEAERGYRSTYYILHTSPYWEDKPLLREALFAIADAGHEIGLHNDAISAALTTGLDPYYILGKALDELRGYGFDIRSTVAHGNALCYDDRGRVRYVNDELFLECVRPALGEPTRKVEGVQLRKVSLAQFGLDFDANWLPRGDYLSDSGGAWSQPFADVAAAFPSKGQLHLLQHPDWWAEAFQRTEVAA